MRITEHRPSYNVMAGDEISVAQYLEDRLDGRDYDGGAVEDAARTADNAVAAIARLCEILGDRGLLTEDNIRKIATGRD